MRFLKLPGSTWLNVDNIVSITAEGYIVRFTMLDKTVHKIEIPTGKSYEAVERYIRMIEGVGLSS